MRMNSFGAGAGAVEHGVCWYRKWSTAKLECSLHRRAPGATRGHAHAPHERGVRRAEVRCKSKREWCDVKKSTRAVCVCVCMYAPAAHLLVTDST
eukprot:3352008-Prymnesium_polylepis.2